MSNLTRFHVTREPHSGGGWIGAISIAVSLAVGWWLLISVSLFVLVQWTTSWLDFIPWLSKRRVHGMLEIGEADVVWNGAKLMPRSSVKVAYLAPDAKLGMLVHLERRGARRNVTFSTGSKPEARRLVAALGFAAERKGLMLRAP